MLASMSQSKRSYSATSGVVATAVAIGIGELVGGLVPGGTSLIVSVGSRVIDGAPPFVKDIAISTLGAADKPVLVIGVVLVTLMIGAGIGVLGSRSLWRAAAGMAGLGLVGGLAMSVNANPWWAAVVAGAAVAAGIGALVSLLRKASEAADGGRRVFLRQAGSLLALGGLAAVAGRAIVEAAATSGARDAVALQPPVTSLAAEAASLAVDGVSPLYMPNGRFYRVDTALSSPKVNPDTWKLSMTGMVDRPLEFSFDDILAMPMVERDVTLACVSNDVGGKYVGNARWQGVLLTDLLDQAGVQPGAEQIVGRSVDGFTVGFPTAAAFDGRTAMVALGMNGVALPIAHGFPARLVVAGLYGYVSATKWLTEIELTTWDAFDAYWIPRGWAKEAPIKTQSRIDVPARGSSVPAGRRPIAGVAWAPTRGVAKVEVQVDGEPWQTATLGDDGGAESWRQWVLYWEASPGEHTISVRATDGDGVLQDEQHRTPRPDGATGWHTIRVSVT